MGRTDGMLRILAGFLAPLTRLITAGEPYDFEADDPLLSSAD